MKENFENENSTDVVREQKNKHIKILLGIGIIAIISIISIVVFSQKNEDNCTNNTVPNSITGVINADTVMVKKPIIYVYPKEEVKLSIKLGKPNNITCSYPKYNNGWNIIARPDGTLTDIETNRELYSLYWEGIQSEPIDLNEGFVVKGCDTIEFLEEKLKILGLNDRETEEFIIYWLPMLQANKYNYIRFATMDEINSNMPLEISIKPDTLIRVLMQYKPLEKWIDVKEQELAITKRSGFVVVEWGGTEIK